jgi:hypothetical protein
MGGLHPFEQALTLLLAFGPFVVLGLVIWRRRREEPEGAGGPESPEDPEDPGDPPDPVDPGDPPDPVDGTVDEDPAGPALPNSTQPEPSENLRTLR